MDTRAHKNRKRATSVKYRVSIRDSAPEDLVQKISDAHARALLAFQARSISDHAEEKTPDAD